MAIVGIVFVLLGVLSDNIAFVAGGIMLWVLYRG